MLTIYEPNVKATIAFLKLLKVRVNDATVNETLQNHPDWPSLLCISDSLHKWNIPNAAGNIVNSEIEQLPVPFMAYTMDREYPLVIVTKVGNGKLTFYPRGNITKPLELKFEDFFKIWNGTYLIAEPDEQSGEENYLSNRKNHAVGNAIPLLLFSSLFFLLIYTLSRSASPLIAAGYITALGIYLHIGLLLAGVIISSFLLWYEIDKNNPALKKVCTGITKGNCDAILSSKQAKLFSWLSWSEVGFFYFTGSLLNLVVAGNNLQSAIILLSWFSILVFPYTIFSVYYQWKVAKQWCILCLGVQLLLVLGAAHSIVFYGLKPIAAIPFSIFSWFLFLFALPPLAWYVIKSSLLKLQEAKTQKREHLRLKFNIKIFDTLLKKQKQITHSADGLGIVLGNPTAKHELIKVCNPYCGPCARAHPEIEKIVEENRNVKAKIIFNTPNDERDIRVKPVQHLLAVAAENNSSKTTRALDDWYMAKKKDYEVFAAMYPMNGELKEQESKVERMYEWCQAMDIHFTPTIFINGYQMPDAYSLKDINYFLLD